MLSLAKKINAFAPIVVGVLADMFGKQLETPFRGCVVWMSSPPGEKAKVVMPWLPPLVNRAYGAPDSTFWLDDSDRWERIAWRRVQVVVRTEGASKAALMVKWEGDWVALSVGSDHPDLDEIALITLAGFCGLIDPGEFVDRLVASSRTSCY